MEREEGGLSMETTRLFCFQRGITNVFQCQHIMGDEVEYELINSFFSFIKIPLNYIVLEVPTIFISY